MKTFNMFHSTHPTSLWLEIPNLLLFSHKYLVQTIGVMGKYDHWDGSESDN
jgi:hypothetical protein